MQIRICGRLVRWQKPIKLRKLTKLPHHAALAAIMAILSSAPSYAAAPCGAPEQKIERSSQSLKTVPKKHTADNIPAMALAMAFGMRSVHGPVQKTAPSARSAFVSHPASQKRQAASMSRERGCVLSSSAIMPPRMIAQ
ncbi:MAG: hypothetical protein DI626_03210 [Micavibrio aeruginosavorus]|uniref:Uncharacterized protein n=1 Tax=Micavibrio aeruginosavorus TaxID=349221 RepID=A0A2W5BXM4_9BACT|nr:MAG: hypothetical protein DI626_03210 [Micavibrio aeruginosavorus]